MNLWALLKNGRIARTVTTTMCLSHMQQEYPDYEVKAFYSLPDNVLEDYQYYRERP